jgi:hypothetical protein
MCHIAFTEITYLQFRCLQIIPATEIKIKTHKKIAQNQELSRCDKNETKLAHPNYSLIKPHL